MNLLAALRDKMRRLTGASTGSISVELAVTITLLVIITLPMVDLGMGAYTQMEVYNAAQAGAEYAAANPTTWTTDAVSNAVKNATSLSSVTVNPAPPSPPGTCGCVVNGQIASATCGSTCASSSTAAGHYVTVGAQATYQPLLDYPFLPSPMTLSSTATVRTE